MDFENKDDSSKTDFQDKETSDVKNVTEEKNISDSLESKKNKNETEVSDKQNIMKQVLEKLDIKKDFQGNYLQENACLNTPQPIMEKTQEQAFVEQSVAQDFLKIKNLEQLGIINSLQGQNLRTQVLKKAFDTLVQNEKLIPTQPVREEKSQMFSEFEKDNPKFFEPNGRKEVFEYLKSDEISFGKDELKRITSLVETVEKNAIERYLKQAAHEKNLINSNESAKQKLTANAQNSSFQDKNLSRLFTREQIGKMSGAEFSKYEPLIMEQLKKGLIK